MCNLKWITWKPHRDTYISGQFHCYPPLEDDLIHPHLKNSFSSSSPKVQYAEYILCPSSSEVEKLRSQAVSAIKWSLQHHCNLFKQPTEKSGFFFKLLSLLIKDSTGPIANVFTTVSSARQTDADQQVGPSLIKGAKHPARLEAIHLQLECYSPKIQGLFLCSSGLSLFSNEPWCDSLEMTKGNDSEAGIKGHREQPLMITQQAGLAHKLMLLVHMSRCGVMNQWRV